VTFHEASEKGKGRGGSLEFLKKKKKVQGKKKSWECRIHSSKYWLERKRKKTGWVGKGGKKTLDHYQKKKSVKWPRAETWGGKGNVLDFKKIQKKKGEKRGGVLSSGQRGCKFTWKRKGWQFRKELAGYEKEK